MLKPADKKQKREGASKSPGRTDKMVKAQSEQVIKPLAADEVNLTLEIKEVRYGRRQVNSPEATTLLNNAKVVSPVPFENPLKYSFRRPEDDMVFKFALTSAGDLLGFLYLEIPLKFKTIKKFRLDDWFPVKMVQTQDTEKLKKENFVARVVINYESSRKLETTALNVTPKTLKTQLAEDVAKGLRQKMDEIHGEVDAFQGEGFKHLEEFHKKLLTKKIKSTTALIEQGKKETLSRSRSPNKSPNKLINTQKETFYKATATLGQADELQNDGLRVRQMFNRSANASPDAVVARKGNSCLTCDNLMKELSYTRKELIEANQKLTAFEEKQMSVDNVKLKKQLEALQDSLNRDRKELNLKLKDHGTILEQDRARLARTATEENNKAYSLQKEATAAIADCKARTKELRDQESELRRRQEDFEARLDELTKNENDYIQRLKSFLKERDEHMRDKEEWEEIKGRMIRERKRIYEEASKFQFLKSDLSLKKEELQVLDDYFGEEKNKFKEEMDNKIAQIETLKYELVKKQEIFDMEQRHFEEQKKLLEDKNARLASEMRQVSQEAARLNQLRARLAKQGEEFALAKDSTTADHRLVLDEIEKDYQFLDQQHRLIEEQKAEMGRMQETLAGFERNLEAQNRLQAEQQAKLNVFSKQLLTKLGMAEYEREDVKRLVEDFGRDLREWEQRLTENHRISRELDKGRSSIRKSLSLIGEKGIKGLNTPDRTSLLERRNTKRIHDIFKLEKGFQDELRIEREGNFGSASPRDTAETEKTIRDLQELVKSQQQRIYELESSSAPRRATENPKVKGSVSVKSDPADPNRLKELQAEMDTIFEQRIQAFKASQPNRANPQKYAERIRAIEQAQKTMHNVLALLSQVNNLRVESLGVEGGLFDHEKLVADYEKKIADLIEFIQRVKDNTDFFNNNMDNEILIR